MKIIIAGDGKVGSNLTRKLSAEGYDLTLIDKITDSNGNTVLQNEPVLHSELKLSDELWNAIHTGMREVVLNHDSFSDYNMEGGVPVSGKTGTAQEVVTKPNHALFVGYAPSDAPKMAIACRIAYGYTSANTAALARDVVNYYFKQKDTQELIPGHAIQVTAGNTRTD
jgi:penicillin-binding protein 2